MNTSSSRPLSSPRPLSISLARLTSSAAVCAVLALAAGHRAHAAPAAWDVDGLTNGVITSGSGTWDNAALNFTDPADTIAHFAWDNAANATDVALFAGTGGTLPFTVAVGAITAGGVQFDTAGYILNGGTLTMNAGTITANVDGRINSAIDGAGGITTSGAGSLVLGGANLFSGPLTINSGMVSLANLALGTIGAGSETVVASGATLNLGGQVYGNLAPGATAEIFRIEGSGVGGIGALINQGSSQINATSKIVLTADATVNTGGDIAVSYNAAGQIVTSAGGRFDVRLNAAPTAGQNHLDLAGFTLTKKGSDRFALVNAHVSDGNIVVDEGQVNLEAGTLLQGGGTITVNAAGKLGFFAVSNAANISRQIVVNGGAIGDTSSTSAAQTIGAPIQITGAGNPNFVAVGTAANTTTLSGQITQSGFTGTELEKRGSGVLVFSNPANSFSAPVTIYAGTLRGNFTTVLGAGGVPPAGPLTTTDRPLGTHGNLTLAGGTLDLRIDLANDATNQFWSYPIAITVDRAPSAMVFDRLTHTSQTNKFVTIASLAFAPASAANQYSIGQNQFTFTQGNTHRLDIPAMMMSSDTVLATGDHNFSGTISSAGKNSLLRTGGNTTQFLSSSTGEFNAFFAIGGNLRVGSGFGTPTVNNSATVGSGSIFQAPGTVSTFRSATNLAPGQIVELLSQNISIATANFEANGEVGASVPTNLRALTTGILGVGSGNYGAIDLSKFGNGTFRIGSNFLGSANGTVTGALTPGAENTVRLGGAGTVTYSGVDAISGSAALEVGGSLMHNTFQSNSQGTAILTQANNYTGGTTVNRGSTLTLQNLNSIGTGAVDLFGTLAVEQAAGSLSADGLTNTNAVTAYGGSTIFLQNAALTGTTNVNRWGDNVPVNLNASTFTVNSRNNNASITLERVGTVTFVGGSVINVNRQNAVAGNVMELDADSFTRSGTGTLEIARSTGTGAGFGVGQFVRALGAAPATIPLSSGTMIAPTITVVDGTRLVNFANYAANGIVNAIPTDVVNTAAFTTGLNTGNQYVYVDFSPGALVSTLGDNPDVAALKVGAGQAAASATTINPGVGTSIRIRTGGLIVSGDVTAGFFSNAGGTQTTINPALNFNDGTSNIEALINVRSATTAIVNGLITANGLTKFGGGTLNLTPNNGGTLSGAVSLNGGTLQAFGPTATGNYNVLGTGQILLNGGQLNLRSNNSAVSGTINPTLQNAGIVVAANIPTATIDLNRSGADSSSTGTFIFNPAVPLSPGLQLQGSPGWQGQTLNISGANYALQFGTNALNSLSGNVSINNAVTLTMNNSPSISGTNPVITKSGAGTWIIGSVATPAGTIQTPGTRVLLNEGTLELRSITAVGTGLTTSLELNRGTLNLRRDSAGTYGGGAAQGYPVSVNGTTTISVDRASANTNLAIGIGPITVRNDATLTVTNGNGFILDTPRLTAEGTAFISSNMTPGSQETSLRVPSAVGGRIVKLGAQHLHFTNTTTFDGGLYVNQGILRLRGSASAGTGSVYLNPGGVLDFNNPFGNMNAGQSLLVRSTTAFPSMISMNVDAPHPTGSVDSTQAPFGIVGLSNTANGTYNTPIDLSTLYGGGWSLGGLPLGAYDARYTAPTLGAGNGNVYRLGGGGLAIFLGIDSGGSPQNNVLTGPNSVRLGIDSGNILPLNMTTFQFGLGGTNDYTGPTVIHRGMVARLGSAASGGFSGLSNGAVNVFGTLMLSSQATLHEAGVATNAVTLHPGATLTLDNVNAMNGTLTAANVLDRVADTAAVGLNGALINFLGATDAVSSETMGDLTFSAGGRLRAARGGTTGTATLTFNRVVRAGAGSSLLLQTSAAGTLGSADKIVAINAPTVTNGMVDPSIVNATDGKFVTHTANGFVNITPDVNLTVASTLAQGLPATTKVNVQSSGALTLGDNPVIYSLRTDRDVLIGGPFNRITLRSGGLIGATNTLTIQPHLVFHDGTNPIEAKITTTSTTNINGTITAAGVTKSGGGALVINVPQTAYASGWTVNSGDLQFNDPQAAGQAVPGNAIVINGAQTTGGQAAQTIAGSRVIFNRDATTAETVTFTSGPITVMNEGTVRINGAADRYFQIPSITATSTGADAHVALTLDVPQNRARTIIPSLTIASDTMLRVFDSGSTTDTGRVTAAAIGSLVGGNKELVKIGNRTLELSGDNSGTFLAGSIVASQGTVRVMHNGSLGSATTAAYFERNATLEIAKSNFVPLGPVLQQPGSIERWNVEDARGLGTYDLPADVNLQLNTNLIAPRTIGLNGGTIEGFLWSDHPAQAVHRTIDPGITINLLANSFVGQNILQGQNYDAGRLPTAAQPFGNTYTGVILCINGTITGAFDLTKTGLDTVIIGGTSNSYNNTIVDMGVLRIGANHALPTGGVLTPRLGGIFDLYGFDQRVSGLGTLTGGPNPGGVSVGSSGHVTNSGVTFNQLQVNHASDYTYNGTIDLNVALTKAGAGTLTIGNGANTYRGATTINEGVLSIDTLADGGLASSIGASSSAAANLVFSGGGALRYTGNSVATDRGFTLNAGGGKIEIPTFATTVLATGTAIGVGSLVKEGDGMLSLGGANTHTGDTRVDGGTLDLAHTNAVQNSTLDTGPAGVQLVTFSVAGTNTYLLGGLKGADDLEISGNTIRVGSNNQTTIFDGALTGVGGSVVKEGAGALTLNGPQSYATLTTTAGRLNLNSTLANAVITDNGGILVINADATNSTVNVNSNPTYFTVSQKLTALSIGPTGRAIVTSTAPAPASDEPAAAFDAASELAAAAAPAAVPEPGTASLLLLGSLALCRSATHRARRRGPRSEHSE